MGGRFGSIFSVHQLHSLFYCMSPFNWIMSM
jgi:hypothetical protein